MNECFTEVAAGARATHVPYFLSRTTITLVVIVFDSNTPRFYHAIGNSVPSEGTTPKVSPKRAKFFVLEH